MYHKCFLAIAVSVAHLHFIRIVGVHEIVKKNVGVRRDTDV